MKKGPYLMISGHDFRSKRKANVHFIVEELSKLDTTRFFSIGFSYLSRIKKDPRLSLWDRANRVEQLDGIETFLWRSFLHPFNLRLSVLSPAAAWWFRKYALSSPTVLRNWITASNTIILESGMAVLFFDLIKSLNPNAKIFYLCSDALATINCAPYLRQELSRVNPHLDGIRIPSKLLRTEFSKASKVFYIPHGIDTANYATNKPSPYRAGINLVSVGSMLFDRTFFEIAAAEFPEFKFHVIGGGIKAIGLSAPNIVVYDEMPFEDTIPYLKHANAGIAPYESENVAPYLTDTSMKLMQFEHIGIPAICPHIVVGSHKSRFGYEPGNRLSIAKSIKDAVQCGHFPGTAALTWKEVTVRILEPEQFSDTVINN